MRLVWISLTSIVFLLLSGCASNNVPTQEPALKDTRYSQYESILQNALAKDDASICEKLRSTEPRDVPTCYAEFASETDNLQVCNQLKDQDGNPEKSSCYTAFAMLINDLEVCGWLEGFNRIDCYARFSAINK